MSLPKAKPEKKAEREPYEFTVGNLSVTLTPHYIGGVGARVMVIVDKPISSLSAEDIQQLATKLKIAACEAESLEKKSSHIG